jgi:hypothetical protein
MTVLRSAVLLLASAPALQAQDPTIGLLSLPEVFGESPCQRFVPREIALHAAPEAQTIGTIRVDRHWSFPNEGGCQGLKVGVHLTNPLGDSELPTEEYDYEVPAAVVVEGREGWFRVRLSDGTAWLRASERNQFFSLERLLTDGLTHLTDAFDGRLSSSPGGALSIHSDSVLAGRNVNVGGFREIAGRLWIQVEVMSWSLCESVEKPTIVARGWLPAHAPSGKPSVWFSSRGC